MQKIIPLFIFLFCFGFNNLAQRPSHQAWNQLLQKYVDENGWVDYRGFTEDSALLNDYLTTLITSPPSHQWKRNEIISYWLNAYNAFTIQLIIRHPGIQSIRDIQKFHPTYESSWDIPIAMIDGKSYDLNAIEHHKLLIPYKDPRIHVALNCGAASCPALNQLAFSAHTLESQLKSLSMKFLKDTTKNIISKNNLKLSSIFNWYVKDFGDPSGLLRFIKKYGPEPRISKQASIQYLEYDWKLNGHFD